MDIGGTGTNATAEETFPASVPAATGGAKPRDDRGTGGRDGATDGLMLNVATRAGMDEGVVWPAQAPARAFRRPASRRRLLSWLVIWDALVPVALVLLTRRFEGAFGPALNGGAAQHTDPLVLMLAVMSPLALAMAGAYHQRRRRGGSRLLFAFRLSVAAMAVSWASLIICAIFGWRVDLAQMLALSLLLPVGWLVGRWACDRHPASGPERTLLIGSGEVARKVLELTLRHPERRLCVVGRIQVHPDGVDDDGPPLLGSLANLPETLAAQAIDRVVVAFEEGRDADLLHVLRLCVRAGVEVDIVPRFFDLVGPAPRAHSLGGLALMEVPGRGLSVPQRAAKRTLDIVGSLALIVLFAPVLAGTAALIAAMDGRPIVFRQARVGQLGRAFSIFKFRTMKTDCDTGGVARLAAAADADGGDSQTTQAISTIVHELKCTSEARVTRLGRILRKTSLDELPQLFNVLQGEMSLVGPRPLRPFEAAALAPWQLARQDLRPGLTGLWQVLGRSGVDWDERIQLDYSYVSHWSFTSDLQILARTVPAVFRRGGAV